MHTQSIGQRMQRPRSDFLEKLHGPRRVPNNAAVQKLRQQGLRQVIRRTLATNNFTHLDDHNFFMWVFRLLEEISRRLPLFSEFAAAVARSPENKS